MALLLTALAQPAFAAPEPALSGAYLAAMQADARNDYAAAADYLDLALASAPDNVALMQNAVVAYVALGDFAAARPIADRLAAAQPENQVAVLVRLADRLAREDFAGAADVIEAAGEGRINPLLGGIVEGWIAVGQNDFAAAQERFDAMGGNAALAAYGQYHKALALALAGDFVSAEAILAGDGNGPLHLGRSGLLAHAQILAQIDRVPEAIALLDAALASGLPDATVSDLRDRLAAGEEVAFDQITGARDGAAEAFLTLAEALGAQQADRLALIHARLAAQIRPDLMEARLIAAGALALEAQYALATEALSEVPPTSPWFVTAEIRRANTQGAAGDPEAEIATLEALAATHGDRIEVQGALGDALRAQERFAEAAEAYGRAIALIEAPQPAHWVLYYSRGIANERAGNWDAAETDFRTALELQPGQPLVLNYLGYSLVEQGRNLDEALAMIEQAVAGQPDDGYITDSLGWVLYRLGRYDEALGYMLRAAELEPTDPVVNDHLGDVLWMADRKREAVFQWRRALSFGPEEEAEAARIRRKLDVGLDAVLAEEATGPRDASNPAAPGEAASRGG